ncbi:MAG: NmrA family NAD(P)-binding protein [Leptolyngbya sp.]|nr:NmrA family NAD(P)-binding protein [Candidatus Melainabacteria bacterium]
MTESRTNKLKRVIVFGATGAQGGPVVAELLRQGVAVRAFTRNAAAARKVLNENVEIFEGNLNDAESLVKALTGVDCAFLHQPMVLMADVAFSVKNFLEAAKAAGLPRIVYTTSGPGLELLKGVPSVDRGRLDAETFLQSSIPTVVLKPTIYLENLLIPFFIQAIKENGVLDYPPVSADRKISWTSLEDQAKIAVAAMTNEQAVGKVFDIATPEPLNGDELAERLTVCLGRTVKFAAQSPKALAAKFSSMVDSTEIGDAICALYEGINTLPADGFVVDTASIEKTFDISLSSTSVWILRQNWDAATTVSHSKTGSSEKSEFSRVTR